MRDNRDWLMAPVLGGLCKYESLIDGTFDLVDIDMMNEALEVRDENSARAQEAARDQRNRHNGR